MSNLPEKETEDVSLPSFRTCFDVFVLMSIIMTEEFTTHGRIACQYYSKVVCGYSVDLPPHPCPPSQYVWYTVIEAQKNS